jgi:tocopherol O-methyltransferase
LVVEADTGTAQAFTAAFGPGLNAAVERYYDTTLDLYEDLWGEHIHHGFWDPGAVPESQDDRKAATDRLVYELVDFAGVPAGSTVLDVGCGVGGPALYLASALNCTVEGVTLSAAQAERAQRKAQDAGLAERARFRQADAMRTGLPDGSFNVVWALESVMHLPDLAAFFVETLRLLRPGGILAVANWTVRDGELDADESALVGQILRHQVAASFASVPEHERLAAAAGYTAITTADWTKAVANSWDPGFASVPKVGGPRAMRELARDRGVDVLGFFYAGPLMMKAYDTGVMTYSVLRAVKPGTDEAGSAAATP